MELEKTNFQGFMKDKKTNVLINCDEEKLKRAQVNKQKFRRQKSFEHRVELLEKEIERLTERITRLETKI
jgi:hypothetical protein